MTVSRLIIRLCTLLAVAFATVLPAHAQSVLRDAETEALFKDAIKPILVAAKIDPKSAQVVLLSDTDINAGTSFQDIGMNAGTILAADDINQVIGVMAHETGHMAGGHSSLRDGITKGATGISLLSLVLGAAAVAAGAGDLGIALITGGQTAAYNDALINSQIIESQADQAGMSYLNKAGISGKGYIAFFEKLQSQEYRNAVTRDAFSTDHPLTTDRIASLEERVQKSPAFNMPIDPALNERFLRIKAKLAGFIFDPQRTFNLYPEKDQSDYAHYARAYAWHKSSQQEKSKAELDWLLAKHPKDPYYLETKGQLLMEAGQVQDALQPLRMAVQIKPDDPLILMEFGQALVATEDTAVFVEARKVLEKSVRLDPDDPFAWLQLGTVYDKLGDTPRTALASAERYRLTGELRRALGSAKTALAGLPRESPEWIRAQDIQVLTEEELKKKKGRGRG